MKYSNTIEYNIKTNLDAKGLTQLKSELQGLELKLQTMGDKGFLDSKTFTDARNQLQGLGQALTDAFDPSLGMLNLSTLNKELQDNGVSAQGLKNAFNSLGAEGQIAFNNLVGQLGKLDTGILRTNSQIDKLFVTFSNTFRWGLVSSFFSQFMNAIHSSVDYVKELDDSLTQIMLVTDYNRDSMNEFARSANEAAKAVSMTTTGMTNASLIFAQQGYNLNQSQELATLSAKLANASQQDTATTSDQITAYMNAYGLENSIDELTQAMDNWALIANVSAADVSELAQASQRAASMANTVGVSGEALAAQIATIESVTREAPEQIGNGLKTLYARFSDISGGGKDEDGVDLGKVTAQLDAIGVKVLDQFGNIRTMDDIMEDLMDVWADLDDTAKIAAAQSLAGKYQVNRFVALMDNRDMYEQYVNATGSAATGTLDQMNEEYADSIAGRTAKMQASLEGLFSTIFNTDDIYPWMDAAQGAVDLLQQFFDALGGGTNILLGAVTVLTRIFSNNLAKEINNAATNQAVQRQKIENLQNSDAALTNLGIINPNYMDDKNSQKILDFARYINEQALNGNFNAEQMNQANEILENLVQNGNAATAAAEELKVGLEQVGTGITSVLGESGFEDFIDEFGAINQSLLNDFLNKQGPNAYQKLFGELKENLRLAEADLTKFNKALQNYQQTLDQYGFESEEVADSTRELKVAFDELQNSLNGETLDRYGQALGEIENGSEEASEEIIKLTSDSARLIEHIHELRNRDFKPVRDNLSQQSFGYRNAQMAFDDDEKVAQAFKKGMTKQADVKNIIDALNAVQSLTFAWQSFQNLGSLWSNEDLSTGEKTVQTIMNLTASLYSLIPAIDKATNSLHFSEKISDAQKEVENSKKAVEDAQRILDLSTQSIDPIKEKVAAAQQAEDEATQAWLNKQEEALQQSKEIAEAARELQQAQDARTDSQKRKNKSTPDMHAAQEKLNKAQEQQAKIKEEILDLEEKTDEAFRNTLDAQGDLNDAIEQQRHAKVDVKKATEDQEAAEKNLVGLEMKRIALNLALSAIISGIAIAIGAIQEEERKRVQAITDAAEESRTNLDAIEKSSFFEQWDAFKENGELTDELKESMAALAQQMGINIEAQDIYDGNIEELNNKLRDNIELEKERARTNFEAENDEFENQLNKDSIKAAQVGTTVTTASGTFNSAVDYVKQAGEAKTLAERLGEVADAQDAVSAARKDFGRDSLEYKKALNEYQKLSDQLKNNDKVDIEKAKSNFKELADLAIEEFKAENANKALTKDDWLNFINAEEGNGIAIREYMTTLGSDVAKEYLDSLLAGLEEGKGSVSQLLQDMMNPEVSADALTSAKETKDPLEELYSKYDKNEGSFSEDEVADILKDHAEYIEYLDKEGEHYVLNRRFLEDYNQAVRDQKQAMDELQGDSFDLRDNQDFLNDKLDNEEDPNQAVYQKLAEANYGMMQGELTSDGFLDATNEALDELVDRLSEIPDYGEAAAEGLDKFAEVLTDLDADAIGMVFDELYGGLKQSAKQFKSGQKTVGQYGEDLLDTTETMMEFAEATGDTRSIEKFQDILDDGAEGAVEFSNAITDNYDQVTQVFDDSFNVLDSAMTATGGVSEQYRGLIETMVASSANFYTQNQEAATAMATSLYADLGDIGYSVSDLRTMLQTGSADLANALMNDASATGTMMKGTASQTQAAISQMASGISSLIAGVMQMIGGISANITGTPSITEGLTESVTFSGSDGSSEKASLHIPGFDMNISGKGSAGSSGGKGIGADTSTFWSNDKHSFVTRNNRTDEITTATNEEIISSGALDAWSTQVSEDLAGGITGLVSLKQYAPPTSTSGGGIPTRSGSGGGGGGKGKSCFVAGTLVSTSFGFKPIEQIQKGDIVLSYNKSLGLNEYSEVLQTMIHNTIEPIYTLHIKNEQLRVTGIHRFLVTDKITCGVSQWIHAADLKVGQWVLFADGTWHVIHKIEINVEHQIVYNFEVSGNHNYYVGRNQILAHNKGGGGGKGKKGGGGGGKAKTIEPKEKKEHEKDYYEEVNSQLDKTEKILSKIEKEEDRLIGDKARANQNKQLSLLQKEITLNKEKQKIQQQELKDVDKLIKSRDKLAEKTAAEQGILGFIPDVQLDEHGVVSNYEQISAEIDKIHNQLIDKYNAAAAKGDEELTKKIAKSIEQFDKYGEDLLKQIQRHNKLQSEIEATTEEIESLNDAIEDIRIDAYKASQEAIDNLKDIQEAGAELDKLFRNFDDDPLSMNRWSLDETPYDKLVEDLSILDNSYSVTKDKATEFYDNIIAQKKKALSQTKDKDEQKAIQSSINFFEGQKANLSDEDLLQNGLLGLSQQDLTRLQGWMDNPNAADNPFGKNTAALYEAYQDAYERTQDLFVEFQEKVRDTRDDILDIYDESEEKIERQIEQFERLTEKVERISNTYTLYYGEDSYDQLDKFYARQGDIMQNQLNKLTDAYNYWQQQYEKALAVGDEKLIQEVQDKMDDAEDAMLDAAEELAELWVEKFENAVNASSQHIYQDLFGSNDIDELTDNWELQKDYMERYKDDVEKAYEVDKLRNKYLDLLDSAQGASLQTQNRIRQQMQEQLDLLNNQKTVSEYDIKLANAKLEILQKQMALEDAQRNKNKMQLRRDTQGNYRYIYTADQGDVRGAQQDLEDSEYDAYEMTKDETTANNDRAINMLQQYIDKRAAIWNKFKDDSTARAEALAQLEAEYQKNFDALAEDFTNTSEGMADILNWLVENGTENTTTAAIDMLNTLYDENGNLKEKTGQDWMDMASLIQDQVLPQIQDAVINADLEMEDQAEDLRDSMVGPDGALTKIGSGADDVTDSMNKAAKATSDLAGATDQLFAALASENGDLQTALNKLAKYEDQLKNTQTATVGLGNQLKRANQTIASKSAEAEHYKTALDFATGAREIDDGSIVKLKKGTFVHYDRYGGAQQDEEGNTGWKLPEDMWVKFGEPVPGKPLPYNFYATGESLKSFGKRQNNGPNGSDARSGVAPTEERHHQAWWFDKQELQKNVLDAMDTGGYTGEWHESTPLWKDGKVAMLHQKELVLNATDTENILAAVNTVREMANAAKMSVGSMPEFKLSGTIKANKETIQQRVEISATFPNVSSITDIEQALLNISDQAYIYANKTI